MTAALPMLSHSRRAAHPHPRVHTDTQDWPGQRQMWEETFCAWDSNSTTGIFMYKQWEVLWLTSSLFSLSGRGWKWPCKMGADMGHYSRQGVTERNSGQSFSSRTHHVLCDISLPFKSIRERGKNTNIWEKPQTLKNFNITAVKCWNHLFKCQFNFECPTSLKPFVLKKGRKLPKSIEVETCFS